MFCVDDEFPSIDSIISLQDVRLECLASLVVLVLDILVVLVVYARYTVLVVLVHSIRVGKVFIETRGHIV